jgi:ABC-type antimicrobial peptide transport system permease subunit
LRHNGAADVTGASNDENSIHAIPLRKAVSQRRLEIGVRLALGADSSGVIRLVLARVGILVTSGLVLGGALSLWLGRLASALLYGLKAHDPTTVLREG